MDYKKAISETLAEYESKLRDENEAEEKIIALISVIVVKVLEKVFRKMYDEIQ